ncbi:hypothetical protein GCM10010466_00320 [Planomonospora alba]|uniref:Uncharacterized protein n=1 Tax=Planomonospora alba TaxID=161354 RepID=A0ABP6MLZ3_9ACTN
MSRPTPACAAGVIRRHRKVPGTPRRRFDPGRRALLVPVRLREGETLAEVAPYEATRGGKASLKTHCR